MPQKSIKLNRDQLRKFIEELKKINIISEEFPGNTNYELIRFKQNERFLVVYKNGTILRTRDPTIDSIIENIISDNLNELYKNFDLIISDHRYGCHAPEIPSIFISHQLRFIAPPGLQAFEFIGFWFNRFFHKKFTHILIPDEFSGGEGVLSGRMSRISPSSRYHFCGILSSLSKEKVQEDIDILFSISGPEPQRTVFEQIIRKKLPRIPGKKVMALGNPESKQVETPSPDLVIYHHPSRKEMENLYNRSKIVVSRSGYSTIMELLELRKKALFVPTPGQTEQIYLAKRLEKLGWFRWVHQNDPDFEKKLHDLSNLKEIDFPFSTELTLSRVLEILDNYYHE